MPRHVRAPCAHRQEVKIILYSIWYHQTYRCDGTRVCMIQFWPPDDEHLCSKHVEAWNKLIIIFSASSFLPGSWFLQLNIKINIEALNKLILKQNCTSSCLNTKINIRQKVCNKSVTIIYYAVLKVPFSFPSSSSASSSRYLVLK